MKNFIFAMCGFLMMSLVSLGVQASNVSELSKCEYVTPAVDVGLPDIQCVSYDVAPANYFVLTVPQFVISDMDSPAMGVVTMNTAIRGKQNVVPNSPFRYIYNSKYWTHYSYTAYSKLITPY
jgi:hypothetical protein